MIAATVAALIAAQGAMAQEPEGELDIEEVTVTGTRVRDSGFTAPTPLTVIGEQEFAAVAPIDVSESLALMPQFDTSSQPSTAVVYANLRSLGAERTLVLLNGRRHVPTFSSGVVDLTTIPTAMIERTEVVTGGASASWGSDAVAGVINMMLKDNLQGIETTLQGGISEYGDDESFSVSVAGGTSFANGRGHLLLGGEYAKAKGIGPLYVEGSRPWAGRGSVANSAGATNGLPELIYTNDVRSANLTRGGLITSGPLRGTVFLPGGQTRAFQYGDVYGTDMIGGGENYLDIPGPAGPLEYPYDRASALGRVRFEFRPGLEGFTELSYSRSLSQAGSIMGQVGGAVAANRGCTTTNLSGSTLNVNINNAFLPQATRDAMISAGITCFNMGRLLAEDGIGFTRTNEGSPSVYRGVIGLNGDVGSRWKWDAYVQYGEATFQQRRGRNIHLTRFNNAIDAVIGTGGQPVCRINADASTANDDPACVPFNLFGEGAPSAAAQAYVVGTSMLDQVIDQTVVAVNFSGPLFELWAGEVSAAFGAEYREESISATVDPDSQLNRWRTSNRKGIHGSYDVKELYAELAVPLLEDKPFAKSVGLQLAARRTDYSSSGGVNTWKVGGTWDLTDSIRLRATQSRDIRAGNLGELFTPTAVSLVSIFNPGTSSINTPVQVTTSGNPTLDPEEADTFTAGVVLSPSALPGLQFSVDYYSIDIAGQIASINGQQVADLCFIQGEQPFCDRITSDPAGVITAINTSFANLNRFKTSGLDIEMRYRVPLQEMLASVPGDLSLRVLGTRVYGREITYLTDGSTEDTAGEFDVPHWKSFFFADYKLGRFGLGLDWRWYGGGNLDNARVEGGVGPGTTNLNKLGSVSYTGLNFSYEAELGNLKRSEFFVRVDNLFDRAPPFPLTSAFNDGGGRGYRAGVRLAF